MAVRLQRIAWTTSLILDANGAMVAEARHLPYGEERWSSGTLPVDCRFTGQRLHRRAWGCTSWGFAGMNPRWEVGLLGIRLCQSPQTPRASIDTTMLAIECLYTLIPADDRGDRP
jgi:hypothetical protein